MSAPCDDYNAGRAEQQRITDAVREITERRALIEQTKGMLMLIYRIDADRAFELLRGQSQQHNVKLRPLAEQVSSDLIRLPTMWPLTQQRGCDGILLTAHQRVAQVANGAAASAGVDVIVA